MTKKRFSELSFFLFYIFIGCKLRSGQTPNKLVGHYLFKTHILSYFNKKQEFIGLYGIS